MKVIRLARIQDMKRALLDERKALRRRDREIAEALKLYESLEGAAEEVESVPPPFHESPTTEPPPAPIRTTVEADTESVAASNQPRTGLPFMRQPRSEGSPVSKVQNRVWSLVTMEPGIERLRVVERVASAVSTSNDSVRETIRRMVKAEKIRMENDRLYPNVPDESEPADDASRQPVLEIAGDRP